MINFMRCAMQERTFLVSVTSIARLYIIHNITTHMSPVNIAEYVLLSASHPGNLRKGFHDSDALFEVLHVRYGPDPLGHLRTPNYTRVM